MRVIQPHGQRGSLKWIQRAVSEYWTELNEPILRHLSHARSIDWLSPLSDDAYAEYRDGEFLDLLGLSAFRDNLAEFWPARGPQWDALGRTDRGDILLVEAKAHIAEVCSPGTAAGETSRARIVARLDEVAARLGARANRAVWADFFYQLANRIAHLDFLRRCGVDAYLILVNFLNDEEMGGPHTPEAWQAAYDVAFHVMGLPKRHSLSAYIFEVYPDVRKADGRGQRTVIYER